MNNYTGYREVNLTETEVIDLTLGEAVNNSPFGCVRNEYLLARYEPDGKRGETRVARFKYDGERFIASAPVGTNLHALRECNPYQAAAMCLLYDRDVLFKVITGDPQSGRWEIVQQACNDLMNKSNISHFDKLLIVGYWCDPTDCFDAAAKCMDGMGSEWMKTALKAEFVDSQNLRGVVLTNSLVIINEADELFLHDLFAVLNSLGDGCQLWITATGSEKIDSIISKFKHHPRFGAIEIKTVERSEISKMADLISDYADFSTRYF